MATIEASLFQLLSPLVDKKVFPDIAPQGTAFPYITYQQVGGSAYQYVEKKLPDNMHSRIQINVWAKTRLEANTIGRNIEKVLIESDLVSEANGALTAIYDDAVKVYGTRQDFSFWHNNN